MVARILVAIGALLPARVRELYRAGLKIRHSRLRWKEKLALARHYTANPLRHPLLVAKFVLWDPEFDNFTYELRNEAELATFLSRMVGVDPAEAARFLVEGREDKVLRDELRAELRRRPDRKQTPLFGRRLGWYALVRILRPGLVVETGIHDGLGSALLLRALDRNAEEGHEGRLISIDINPAAGWLVPEQLRARWQPTFESTYTALPAALDAERVGMIIHDSEHTYACEQFEFTTALSHAASTLALVSDNAHATSALEDICRSVDVEYGFFKEVPRRHIYPGAGIGLGIVDKARSAMSSP